jgi:hypothetical protein
MPVVLYGASLGVLSGWGNTKIFTALNQATRSALSPMCRVTGHGGAAEIRVCFAVSATRTTIAVTGTTSCNSR